MLNFLNTTVLFAAVASLIPLIIHLFSKRKVKIIEFSSLKHLKAMQRRQVRRLKIRQLLLLIVRMLIILSVVLAFARPTTTGGHVGSHASVSAVILFDNSASMNRYVTDGNLFHIAKRRTARLLETFGESDQVALIPLLQSQHSEQSPSLASSAIAQEILNRLDCGHGEAGLESSLDKAIELLKGAASLNKEIYVVTDRQRHSLPDTSILMGIDANVFLVDLPVERAENCGVTSVDFGGQLIIPGHDFVITASVRNYGTSEQNDIIASLFIDGNRIAQTDFGLAAEEETPVRFVRSISRAGFHSGYVELSDDKFTGDNRYYFSLTIPERFNLLVIDGDGTGGLISLALVPSQSINQYWSVKTAAPEDLSGVNFPDYDVIILAGAPRMPETYTQRLRAYVQLGKSLFVTYDGRTDIDDFNRYWSPLTGVVFEKPIRPDFTRAGYYSLLSADIDHPIFSVFGLEKHALPEIKFYALPSLRIEGKARTLLRFTGDRPALVESSFGGGKVLTLTGPIAPDYSDISGHAFFVPFISRIAEYLASDLSSYDLKLFCGDNISRSLSVKSSVRSSLDLITPDSASYSLAPEEGEGALVLRVAPTDRPGVYRISHSGREIDRFALNVIPAECDLSAVDADQFATAVGADEACILDPTAELASVISEYRYGKELWQLFLWVAVVLILAEVLLARGSSQEE